MKKLISVIVLVYNNLEFLPECICSICDQNYDEIEIIIGDDHSKNFSFSYVFNSISKYARLNIKSVTIYSNEVNSGVVANYIKALSYVKGEYIFYLAADDLFYDNTVLGSIYNEFINSHFLILTGYRMCFDNLGNKYIRPHSEEVSVLKYSSIQQKYSRIVQKNIIAGANTPFHRSLITEFSNLIGYHHLEDWPRYISLLEKNIDIGFVDKTLIYYRLGGLTTNNDDHLLQKDYRLLFEKTITLELIRSMKSKKFLVGIIDAYEKENLILTLETILGRSLDQLIIYKDLQMQVDINNDSYVFVFTSSNYYYIAKILEKKNLAEGRDFSLINKEKLFYLAGKVHTVC